MKRILFILIALVALSGCAQVNQTKIALAVQSTLTTAVPTITPIPQPTSTSIPTATPTPKPTTDIQPTNTVVPTALPTQKPILSCKEQVLSWRNDITPLLKQYVHYSNAARKAVYRSDLATPITQMQAAVDNLKLATPPDCAILANQLMLDSYSKYIESVTAIMNGESDAEIMALGNSYNELTLKYWAEMDRLTDKEWIRITE